MNYPAGVDNSALDNRKFNPSRDDIERVCRFFSIGKLKSYEKEKNGSVSHSNFFVLVLTTQGPYALKFYPLNSARSIALEFAVNRLLTGHHFPTPVMYAGLRGHPSIASNGRRAACYSFIDGAPVWKHIKKRSTIRQVNAALFSLKRSLSAGEKRIPCQKQESLTQSISDLLKTSRLNAPYDQNEMINASLQDAYKTFQRHQPLFTRQRLHNNAGLTNFILYKRTVYTLDLSHVKEDYVLADLASLVISCLFFEIPKTTIRTIVKDHFTQHKIKPINAMVLHTLVKVGLIKEYLKNIQREGSVQLSNCTSDLARLYRSHLAKRIKLIVALLKKEIPYEL